MKYPIAGDVAMVKIGYFTDEIPYCKRRRDGKDRVLHYVKYPIAVDVEMRQRQRQRQRQTQRHGGRGIQRQPWIASLADLT